MSVYEPVYLKAYNQGRLQSILKELLEIVDGCRLCPRKCGTKRLEDKRGFCKTGRQAIVGSYGPHFGEEAPLVGKSGSGTIFFTYCNLMCLFCQNYDLSHGGEGREVTPKEMARMMLSLQQQGCHNINFVTPTHVTLQIVEALIEAIPMGFKLPIVYNCGGYESTDTLELLSDVVDIFMPDFKFWEEDSSKLYMNAPDYPEVTRKALLKIHEIVGELQVDASGVARRGLLVRHLVMPGGLKETEEILKFISKEISPNTYVNVMGQYRPCGEAYKYPPINESLSGSEYSEALSIAEKVGLKRLDKGPFTRLFRWLH